MVEGEGKENAQLILVRLLVNLVFVANFVKVGLVLVLRQFILKNQIPDEELRLLCILELSGGILPSAPL